VADHIQGFRIDIVDKLVFCQARKRDENVCGKTPRVQTGVTDCENLPGLLYWFKRAGVHESTGE
jgi:hypothetical protein